MNLPSTIMSAGFTGSPAVLGFINFWETLFGNHPADPVSKAEEIATYTNIIVYGVCAVIIGGIILGAMFMLSSRLMKSRDYTKHLKFWFVVAWGLAFIVYDVGMYTGQYISLVTNAPMAVIHAFETFLLGSDVSAIHAPFHNSWMYMFFFSLSHALSAVVSTLFLIKIFGFNIIQKWRLRKERKGAVKPETFVLWGVDNMTYKMASSIKNHYESQCTPYRIIVINTGDSSDDNTEKAIGFNKIFEIISLKDSELRQYQELGCLIANATSYNLDSASGEVEDLLRTKLNLKSVAKILSDKTASKIHILFLSDNEKQNLHYVSVLLKDSTLNTFANSGEDRRITFYCHARYNRIHRVIEDVNSSRNMEVRIIDSSHINVELLKSNKNVLPVNFVDVEADATVSSSFNSMVIGFSEVGQDAVRFLYEYGAFVKPGGDDAHAKRSDFHLDVIDNHMEEKAGVFLANAPAISPSLAYIPKTRNSSALIELHNLDCRSEQFFFMLEQKIQELNYIVIATDNDELNMTMGVRVFRAATRYRGNLDKLCILIRVHEDADGHFQKIAEYYNKLWASQTSSNIQGNEPNTTHKKSDPAILPLYIFGLDKDVYTYINIIDDSVIKKAIKFKEKYEAATNPDYIESENEREKVWFKEQRKLLQVDSEFHTAYACLMRLRRTQRQDIANSQHWCTKELLAAEALQKSGIADFPWSSLKRTIGETVYTTKSGENVDIRIARLLTVLAQTEHLRWKASHEILGYVYDANGKNEVKLHHNCLTDWDNLTTNFRSHDFNVVDITLGII